MQTYDKDISVVISLFNEEDSLPELVERIDKVMSDNSFTYEIIMVDDGSTDSSWEVIGKLSKRFPAIRGISFRRNYGKSAALHNGFKAAEGSLVVKHNLAKVKLRVRFPLPAPNNLIDGDIAKW